MERQKELRSPDPLWLFENHVEFLSTHRGKTTSLTDAWTIESDRPEFTYAVMGKNADRGLLDRFTTVHLAPLDGECPETIDDARYQYRAALSYMSFDGSTADWPRNPHVTVKLMRDEAGLDVFSQVQARGFASKPEHYDQWHPWLRAANQRNLGNKSQQFYVGYLDKKPVGTTLVVRTKGLAGIYAVATLPEARKQGVASMIMAQAIEDARATGIETITLQVAQGSYAETLYEKLGFLKRFSAKIFAR